MNHLKKSIALLALLVTVIATYGQIKTPEIEVGEFGATSIEVNEIEKVRVEDSVVKVLGDFEVLDSSDQLILSARPAEVISNKTLKVNGNLEVSGRLYFGGGTNSSYIQHLDGGIPARENNVSGVTEINIHVNPGAFVNIYVNIGGRSYDAFQLEYKVFGYMFGSPGNNWIRGVPLSTYANMGISYEFVNAGHIKLKIHNHQGNFAMYSGYMVVSQHGYGF